MPFQHLENLAATNGRAGLHGLARDPGTASRHGGQRHRVLPQLRRRRGVRQHDAASPAHIIHWRLTNTRSLDSAHPNVQLHRSFVGVREYSVPPDMVSARATPAGGLLNQDCFGIGPATRREPEGPLDANDTRMQQVVYHAGRLWGRSTPPRLEGPAAERHRLLRRLPGRGNLQRQARIKVGGNNVTRPSINMLDRGGVVT